MQREKEEPVAGFLTTRVLRLPSFKSQDQLFHPGCRWPLEYTTVPLGMVKVEVCSFREARSSSGTGEEETEESAAQATEETRKMRNRRDAFSILLLVEIMSLKHMY